MELGKLPPSAIDFEEIVLGSCMLNEDALKSALEILNPSMFYKEYHQIIFEAIAVLTKTKMPVDILTVVQQLKHIKNLDKITDGAFYVTKLTNRTSGIGTIEYHCRIVQQMYLKRQTISLGMTLLQKGYDEGEDCFDIIDHAKNTLKLLEGSIASDGLVDNKKTIDEVIVDINTAKSNGGIIGYSTGIKSLDLGIMGLRGGMKYVIGALPSQGKTSLAKNICIDMAHKQNIPGVFFSMDMPRKQLMLSCISEILNIPNDRLQQGKTTQAEEVRIESLKQTLFQKNFLIDDKAGLSPEDIRRRVRKLVESHNIKWFVLDYLGLMKLKGGDARNKNREQVVSEITAEMRSIAKDYNLVCIELSQLTKEVAKGSKDMRPRVHHLRDSGSIEANADIVMLIYRPEKHGIKQINGVSTEGYAEIIIDKNRTGALKILLTKYQGNITKFMEDERGTEVEYVSNEEDAGF